jgi:hypothetical protein
MAAVNPACTQVQPPVCEAGQPNPAEAALCGHTPEQFAEAALAVEPHGAIWCRSFSTNRAALYRAFGRLLSDFEQRICVLFQESLACGSVELLPEWEAEYGLPGTCAPGAYPTDLSARQAQVCAARQSVGISTSLQLQTLLRTALQCSFLTVEDFYVHNVMGTGMGQPLMLYGGVCVRGLGPTPPAPWVHNVMGGWGLNVGPSAGVYGSSVGQPLTLVDPSYMPPPECPTTPERFTLLSCLMKKHLPAHVTWMLCV